MSLSLLCLKMNTSKKAEKNIWINKDNFLTHETRTLCCAHLGIPPHKRWLTREQHNLLERKMIQFHYYFFLDYYLTKSMKNIFDMFFIAIKMTERGCCYWYFLHPDKKPWGENKFNSMWVKNNCIKMFFIFFNRKWGLPYEIVDMIHDFV